MTVYKISTLLAACAIASPVPLPAVHSQVAQQETVSKTASARRMRSLLAPTPVLAPMGTYVGQLQEKWQFPSDHLPIAMTFQNTHFASWNVLDNDYMSWVTEKDSQGLVRSMIVDEHIPIVGKQITVRDQHVIDLILGMLSDPVHPRSIVTLQECNVPFNDELRAQLPENFELLSCYGETLLVDRSKFEIVETKTVSGIFSQIPKRAFQEVLLRKTGSEELIRLINGHLPGDPAGPARFEFGQYLANTLNPSITTIAMGDMNFNELEMQDALARANAPYQLYAPYCTNITPVEFNSKCIDHFIVYSPEGASITVSQPDEVMPNLSQTVNLLN